MSTFTENVKRWWNDDSNFTRCDNGHYWRTFKLKRKRKRHELTPLDTGLLPKCPKWWNKQEHIRPNRRRWKHVEYRLTQDPDSWYGIDLPTHARKPHSYWW